MNFLYTLLISVLVLSATVTYSQTISNARGADNTSIEYESSDQSILKVEKVVLDNTYKRLEASLRHDEIATDNVFCDTDIQLYLLKYDSQEAIPKDVDFQSALNRVESSVRDAEEKLRRIGNAQNVTLMGSKSFYGDEYQISKVIQHRVDIVAENGDPFLFDVLFVEISGEYKIFAVLEEL